MRLLVNVALLLLGLSLALLGAMLDVIANAAAAGRDWCNGMALLIVWRLL
jgi:hypothetical protein